MAMFWGPIVAAVAFICWWMFASRIAWRDRALVLLACVVLGGISYLCWHKSFGIFGLIIYAIPAVLTVWIAWLIVSSFFDWPIQRVGLLVVFVLAWGYFTLIRFEGINGAMSATLAFRWTPTAEEKFLASVTPTKNTPAAQDSASVSPLVQQAGDWTGFRGANRDGRLTGTQIETDWDKHSPKLVWRHRIGPGWSSFTVIGNRLFTQEQRDKNEAVVCYDSDTGKEIWAHEDPVRFEEIIAGPGPRATPTFDQGKIYALGGAGRINCLDAATGKLVWTHDIVEDSKATVPQWGFSASPLVTDGIATVFAGGPEKKCVLGYDAVTGDLKWTAGGGQFSYCSLQPAKLDGVEQLIIATDAGLTAFQPEDGKILWQGKWPLEGGMARIVQPTVLDDSGILLGTGFGFGTRRFQVDHSADGWSVQEKWTTRAFKPYYNDMVAQGDHLYGFDGNILACINLKDGATKWRQRGFGNGQVLLLADQNVLLVLSETGEAALVLASPEKYQELSRFQAIDGKTWNHPVIAHGKLFVRNAEEAACYQLTEKSAAIAGE
jgi:outer membrane protein assembly factor BamB